MNRIATETRIACVYRRVWPDGYGARGWKLRRAIHDPEIIASTPETGDRIPTSVFVHDVLDHALCGLGPSGHRNEAVALGQLASRTGADPMSDYAQIVDEDLLPGRVLGERLRDLLPADLAGRLPTHPVQDSDAVALLERQLGRRELRSRLIDRLREIGDAGASKAKARYRRHGLAYGRRRELGLALQDLLSQADCFALEHALPSAEARLGIGPDRCRLEILGPIGCQWSRAY